MANEQKQVLSGTTTTVISHAATLNNNAWVYSGLTGFTGTQLNNSTELYPWARCVLNINDTFAAAPSAGAFIGLYMIKEDVDGTTDETPPPDATALKGAQFVGAFPITAYDVAHVVAINISLEGVARALFYIENKTGQQISYSSVATTVKVTPFTYAPT